MKSLYTVTALARDDTESRTTRGLVVALLTYNLVATAVLAFAGIGLGLHGVALWPAVVSTRQWASGVERACGAVLK